MQNIISAYRKAGLLAVAKAKELSIDIATDDAAAQRDMLVRCAMTSMNSKLVRRQLRCLGFRDVYLDWWLAFCCAEYMKQSSDASRADGRREHVTARIQHVP